MKITQISAEISLSRNYQKYTVGMVAEIEAEEDEVYMTQMLQAKCRKLANEQIKLDETKEKVN